MVLLLSGITFAQENDCFRIGFKAGVNLSQYHFAPENKSTYELLGLKPRIGYYAGLTTNFRISQRTSLQPELLLAMQGSAIHNSGVDDLKTIDELTISVPVRIRFQIFDRLYVACGPQFAYIFDQSNGLRIASVSDLNRFSIDKLDLGLAIGSGYRIKQKWAVNVQYFRGLIERDNLVTSSVINLGLGYWF